MHSHFSLEKQLALVGFHDFEASLHFSSNIMLRRRPIHSDMIEPSALGPVVTTSSVREYHVTDERSPPAIDS